MTTNELTAANRVQNDHKRSEQDLQIGGIRRGPLPKKNYMVLPNEIVHARLTFKALGVLTFFLEKPADWVIASPEALSRLGGREGRDAIRAAFKELQDAGYMVQNKCRDQNGRFITEWVIYDYPVDNSKGKSPGETNNGLPEAENQRRLTGGGNPLSYISTNKLNTHLKQNSNLPVGNSDYQTKCKKCAGGWLIDADGYEIQPLKRCDCDYSIPKAGRSLPPEESWEVRKNKNNGQSGQTNKSLGSTK